MPTQARSLDRRRQHLDRGHALQFPPPPFIGTVKGRIRAAGGTRSKQHHRGVGRHSMGTEGMKASLISRGSHCRLHELVARGHLFDGVVACPVATRRFSAPSWPSAA
ncbi:MAG: dihydroxy-acid dehydratase [Nitrospira sp.]|nr:dihydroxy-acid dehydratase [Nitrospira sp.]